jgi:hypothetical protein
MKNNNNKKVMIMTNKGVKKKMKMRMDKTKRIKRTKRKKTMSKKETIIRSI